MIRMMFEVRKRNTRTEREHNDTISVDEQCMQRLPKTSYTMEKA